MAKFSTKQGQFALDQNEGWKDWMNWLKVARDEPNFSLTDDIELLETAFIEGRLAYTKLPIELDSLIISEI